MTTISLYNDGAHFSNQPYGVKPETVEHYDFDGFGVNLSMPVVRFRLRTQYMIPAYLEVAVGSLVAIITPVHWDKRKLTEPAKSYIRTKALVALLNGWRFENHCMYLQVQAEPRRSVTVGIDPIGGRISSGVSAVDRAWLPIMLGSDDFRRIELSNKMALLKESYPDAHLVTDGRLEPTVNTNLNPEQIGRNRASNYALVHIHDGEFALVIGDGMGIMELVRQVVAMNTDIHGITKDNIAAVRAALLSTTVDELGWDKSGTWTTKDYEGWEITQRFNKFTRLVTFRSAIDLVDSPEQGSVAFSVNVPFDDITPMRDLLSSLTKSKFSV